MSSDVLSTRVPAASSEGTDPFRVTDIPLFLFKEISGELGLGEAKEMDRDLVQPLNPEHPSVGFRGAIGLSSRFPEVGGTLYLWDHIPDPERTSYINLDFALKILGAPLETGGWSLGQGNRVVDRLTVEIHELYLPARAAPLILRIIERANALASNPDCRALAYWDGRTG